MLNMEYVPELLVLAETLSYTETARRLHVSHSVVSRHIDAVERTLGVRLFDRTTRKVELTDAGRAVIADSLPCRLITLMCLMSLVGLRGMRQSYG